MPIQRKMIFKDSINSASALVKPSISHQYCLELSKNYIKNKNLLNVGSWIGQYEALAVDYTNQITSVDIENKALQVLHNSYPHIKCVQAYSHKLPFQNNSFDVVTFWAVIEHIPAGYELVSLMEINRVLKPNGYIFISTMNKCTITDILDPAYWLV